jgi:hypothetical protein
MITYVFWLVSSENHPLLVTHSYEEEKSKRSPSKRHWKLGEEGKETHDCLLKRA